MNTLKKQIIAVVISLISICLAVAYYLKPLKTKAPVETEQYFDLNESEKFVDTTDDKLQGSANFTQQAMTENSDNNVPFYPRVTFTNISPSTYSPIYKVNGQVNAQYKLNLPSEVEGKIVEISKNFEAGHIVKKGDVLASVEDYRYRAQLIKAEQRLLSATINLEQRLSESKQAKADWEKVGSSNIPTQLSLKIPNVKLAKLAVKAAQIEYEKSFDALKDTVIVAPFNAVVEQRDIAIGAYISPGMTIARLHSIENYKVVLPLDASQWKNLPTQLTEAIKIIPIAGSLGTWFSSTQILANQVDENTRQRNLVVNIANPLNKKQKLLAGSFVEAQVVGKPQHTLLKVPVSAVTSDGYIWFIERDETLNRHKAKIHFTSDAFAYLKAFNKKPIKLVTHPMVSFITGQPINAIEGE